ncbi:hypothetical protein [Lactobacillus sp. ESL0703]|uniref:hypothetical protein n=1 Tax=Lactobacillus sp. ESL0703 TaxID=2983218 RepID=UPI0023F930F3|nr:hypothetical protein [Lactobacillus sp. ESL0703]MDF7669337.1 hypothetical protein [Lactobacillus sp. ESL0703]
MATVQIGVRLSEKEKNEFENNAKAIGLTASAALKVFIAKFNHDKGFSYPITAEDNLNSADRLPKEVENAMIIAKAEELGLIDDTSESVTSIEDLRKRWENK